ncbi:MAG: hypothetical protein AB1938_14220 [Myxococcota bacterium]
MSLRRPFALAGLAVAMAVSVFLPVAGEGFRVTPAELSKLVGMVVAVALISAGLSRSFRARRTLLRQVVVATGLSEVVCVTAAFAAAWLTAKRPSEVVMWAPIIVPVLAITLFPTVVCAVVAATPSLPRSEQPTGAARN